MQHTFTWNVGERDRETARERERERERERDGRKLRENGA